jgi:hypothetical protein
MDHLRTTDLIISRLRVDLRNAFEPFQKLPGTVTSADQTEVNTTVPLRRRHCHTIRLIIFPRPSHLHVYRPQPQMRGSAGHNYSRIRPAKAWKYLVS